MADRYWVGGAGTWDTSSTTVWSTSSGGASGASVPTATDSVFFDAGSGVPGTVTLTGALTCLDITVSLIGWTFASTGTIAISGNMSLTALTTWTGTGTLTFNSTATGKTITTSGTTFSCAIVFNGAGGGWTLGGAFTATSTATLTAGAFAYSSYTFTCTTWSSSNVNTRSIDGTGTGEIVVTNSSGTVVNMATQTGMTTTGHPDFHSLSNSGATPTFSMGVPTEANTCSVIIEQGGAGGSSLTSGNSIYNITVTDGSVGGLAQTIYGDVYLGSSADSTAVQSANVTWTMARTSGTSTLTGNGKAAAVNFDINCPGATVQLADAFAATSRSLILTSGTLNLNNQVFSAFRLNADNTGTRTLAFGSTGRIDCTIDDAANSVCAINATNLTVTGTPVIKSTYSGANGVTFTMGAPTEGNSISLLAGNNTGGTVVTGSVKNITFTAAYAGAFTTGGVIYYGNLILVSTMSTVASASAVTFAATSSKTITTAGVTLNFPVTFNGVGGTWTLQDALTLGSTRALTLTNGSLALGSYTLTANTFSSSNANTRTLGFGTGKIVVVGSGATIWTTSTVTGLTVSGTPVVEATYSGSVGTRTITTGSLSEANSISFKVTAGTDIVATGAVNRDLILTGFAGTWSNTVRTVYGNLTIPAGVTVTAGTNATTFGATSGTQTITTNAVTLDFPLAFNGVGGTFTLGGALTSGATRTTTFANGTLSLGSYTLTTGIFTSANSNVRALNFGTGNITLTSAATATIWDITPAANMTISGTAVVNTTGGGATTKTILNGAVAGVSTVVSFNLQNSAGTVAFTAANTIKSLTLNGAFTLSNIAISIYGDYTYTASTTLTAGANAWTFASTGSQTINSGATTLDFPITFNGAGGTWALGAGLTVGSTRLTTLTNGTLNLAGYTFSTGTFATATGTKNITFNAGTLTVVGSGATAFNNAQPTNFTTTAGTGTGFISMSSATAKTFVGGGSTFNATLSQDGAGALTITGSNTLADIRNTTQPVTVSFTAATTTTFTSGFSLSGTAGNLVTIGSVTAASHTLSKASGTVNVSFCTISRSSATGGATWQAFTANGNVDGGNNTGWLFASAGYTITANNGTYALTGQSAVVTKTRLIIANNGTYALTGQSAILLYGVSYTLTANNGTYALAGQGATISRSRLLLPLNGVYSLTGYAADIAYAPTPTPVANVEYFIEIRSFTERRRF